MDKLKKYLPLVGLIAFFILINIYKYSDKWYWIAPVAWSLGLGIGAGLIVGIAWLLYVYKYTEKKLDPIDWPTIMEAGLITTVIATSLLLFLSLIDGVQAFNYLAPVGLFEKCKTGFIWSEAVTSAILFLFIPGLIKLIGIIGLKVKKFYEDSTAEPTEKSSAKSEGGWILWVVGGLIAFIAIAALVGSVTGKVKNNNPHQYRSETPNGQYQQSDPTPLPGYHALPPTNTPKVTDLGADAGMESSFK